jgi:hypothetical protein
MIGYRLVQKNQWQDSPPSRLIKYSTLPHYVCQDAYALALFGEEKNTAATDSLPINNSLRIACSGLPDGITFFSPHFVRYAKMV